MTDEYFDPRAVALNHAQGADHADPVALAMVYVGDQLGTIINLLEQLDVTINNTLIGVAEAVEDSRAAAILRAAPVDTRNARATQTA